MGFTRYFGVSIVDFEQINKCKLGVFSKTTTKMNDAKIDSSMNYELVQVSESKSMKVLNKVNSWKKREVLRMGDPSQGSDL